MIISNFLSILKEWTPTAATLVSIVVGLFALAAAYRGFFEYQSQGIQKRAEKFFEMQKQFDANPSFRRLMDLLDDEVDTNNEKAWSGLSDRERTDYLGFFEEIALMVNSGLIKPEVAYTFFGWYAIRCEESKLFWTKNLWKKSKYWKLFHDFATQMKRIDQSNMINARNLKI